MRRCRPASQHEHDAADAWAGEQRDLGGRPTIVRLHGQGRVVLASDDELEALRSALHEERTLGQRAIVVDVTRIADSCGFSVPLTDFRGDRDVLDRALERRDPECFDAACGTVPCTEHTVIATGPCAHGGSTPASSTVGASPPPAPPAHGGSAVLASRAAGRPPPSRRTRCGPEV